MILGKESVIPEDFAEKIAKMAGFRNILVHGYSEIDEIIVYDYVINGLDDFKTFIKYIIQYLS